MGCLLVISVLLTRTTCITEPL
uniref:Uncharacterized protein n=1 Tax=Arundo donax TaxID=35708 RepID=A0A0A8ZBC7_ARUDO